MSRTYSSGGVTQKMITRLNEKWNPILERSLLLVENTFHTFIFFEGEWSDHIVKKPKVRIFLEASISANDANVSESIANTLFDGSSGKKSFLLLLLLWCCCCKGIQSIARLKIIQYSTCYYDYCDHSFNFYGTTVCWANELLKILSPPNLQYAILESWWYVESYDTFHQIVYRALCEGRFRDCRPKRPKCPKSGRWAAKAIWWNVPYDYYTIHVISFPK